MRVDIGFEVWCHFKEYTTKWRVKWRVRARNPIQKTACTFRNRQYPQNTPVSDTGDIVEP
jgi:hypothetical protein